jgi:hypothetical protein
MAGLKIFPDFLSGTPNPWCASAERPMLKYKRGINRDKGDTGDGKSWYGGMGVSEYRGKSANYLTRLLRTGFGI